MPFLRLKCFSRVRRSDYIRIWIVKTFRNIMITDEIRQDTVGFCMTQRTFLDMFFRISNSVGNGNIFFGN